MVAVVAMRAGLTRRDHAGLPQNSEAEMGVGNEQDQSWGHDQAAAARGDIVLDATDRVILTAARELFAEHGYHRTSMAQVAKRAGVVRATIYNHFQRKVDLLRAIVADYMAGYVRIGNELQASAGAQQSVFDILQLTAQRAIDWRIANADLRPLIDLAKHIRESGWEEFNAEADAAMLGWISRIHRANNRRGITRPGLDLDFATAAVYSMIETALSGFDVRSSQQYVDHVAHQLTLLQWNAIYAIEPERAPRVEEVLGLARGRRTPLDNLSNQG
jgi:AcrR family transcriptional regulator